MKKRILCLATALFVVLGLFSGVVFADEEKVTVTFIESDHTSYTIEVEKGVQMHELPAPDFDGNYMFGGWFTDEECTHVYSVDAPVNEDITLYGKWISLELPFKDVDKTHEFYDKIQFVYFCGIMNGVSEDSFAPDDSLSRAMIVTILHRTSGSHVVNYAMSFDDVKDGEYYTEAVRWAQAEGIVNGMTETEFAPDVNVTREQLAAIIYRYATNYCKINMNKASENTNTLSYDDIMDIEEYASPAVHACLAVGALKGRERNIEPKSDATRAEAANAISALEYLDEFVELEDERPTYKELEGDYQDSYSQRASLNAVSDGENGLDITVKWADSAFEYVQWTMKAAYNEDGKLEYTDCVEKLISADEQGNEKEEVKNENGKGYFSVYEGTLLWGGAQEDNCKECVFERNIANMVNPLETADAEKMMEMLGLKFNLPEGSEDVKYFIIGGKIAEVRFVLDKVEYTGRISASTEFEDISGMYYEWTVEDKASVKGVDAVVKRYIGEDKTTDVCLWYDAAPGIMYSLSAESDDLDGFDIQAVAEYMYVPVQGNVG